MSAKTALRDTAARLLYAAGLTAPALRAHARLSIATFHRVLPGDEREAYPFPGLAVTPAELDLLLAWFVRNFDCGTLEAQHARFVAGDAPSKPLLAVTFDDGQYDNHRHARPALARQGIKATFFIPVGAVERGEALWHDRLGFAVYALLDSVARGRERIESLLGGARLRPDGASGIAGQVVAAAKRLPPADRAQLVDAIVDASGGRCVPEFARLMTIEEIAQLAADGHEIGSHSMTHRMMPECDDQALGWEVAESRRVLRAYTGQAVESFCYPNGDCDERSVRAVATAGYRRAVTTTWGRNGRAADPFRLRRCDMDASRMLDAGGRFVPAVLALRMSGMHPRLR